MNVKQTGIPGVLVIEPRVFGDDRGFFMESYNRRAFRAATGIDPDFVQDNHSLSERHVLRGLHYQIKQAQGKLVRVAFGEAFDVAVDIRRTSPTFGKWVGLTLSAENKQQLWIPPGCAHGFVALSERCEFLYKATDYYAREHERCIAWNDPDIGIVWPLSVPPVVSEKDAAGLSLKQAEVFDEAPVEF